MAKPPGPASPFARVASVRTTFAHDLETVCGLESHTSVELTDATSERHENTPHPARVGGLAEAGGAPLRYNYIGEVGHGGMGAVYRVFDQNLRRTQAMKVILAPGGDMDTQLTDRHRELSSRFLEEAQITGQLEHPGVVPVYDLGIDEDRQLYFTMRLVRGETFEEVLEHVAAGEQNWNLTRALGVLIKVCDTMSYAHDKGVLHRDLKPANVMVGRYGEVYVVDWGLARVDGRKDSRDLRPKGGSEMSLQTERKDLDASSPLVTMDGTVVGTPYYMSREQATGRTDQVGPRSDVYAVGAMLYHLLTGNMPYHTPGDSPSAYTVLAMVIHGPPRSVHEMAPQVPAELVAICERAMAREPEDRYASMAEMGNDLRAYIEHRVVHAYETGALAELRKWVVRNKALAASICATALVSLGGVSAIGYLQSRAAARQEGLNQELTASYASLEQVNDALSKLNDRLEAERATSERVVTFLTDMFRQEDPTFSRGETITVKEVLDDEVLRIRTRLAEEPEVHARLMGSMGSVYQALALLGPARALLVDALDETRAVHGDESPLTWTAQDNLGSVLIDTGEYAEARPLVEATLDARTTALGPDDPDTLLSLFRMGTLTFYEGDSADSIRLLEQAADGQAEALGPEDAATLETRRNLAAVRIAAGQVERGVEDYREIVADLKDSLGVDDPRTLFGTANLAFALGLQNRLDESEAIGVETLDHRTRVLGEDHPDTLTSVHNLAETHFLQGRLDEARDGYRAAYERRVARLGPYSRDTLLSMASLAYTLLASNEFDAAAELYEEFLPLARQTLSPTEPAYRQALVHLSQRYRNQGRDAEADALDEEHAEAIAADGR